MNRSHPLGAFLFNIAEAYVSHSSWRLLYYYDLTDFYENISQYRDCLQKMEQICNHLMEIGESSQCLSLIYKHRKFSNEMKIDTDYLNSLQREDRTNHQFYSSTFECKRQQVRAINLRIFFNKDIKFLKNISMRKNS